MLQSVSLAASCSVIYVMAMFNGKRSFLFNNGRYVPLKNPILQFDFYFMHTNSQEEMLGDNLAVGKTGCFF